SVEAERDRLDTRRHEPPDLLTSQQWSTAWRHGYRKSERPRGLDEREQIDALQRVPSRHHEVRQRAPKARQSVEQVLAFRRAEFGQLGGRRSLRPAMSAGQIAGPRYLPVHTAWRPIEDVARHHGIPASLAPRLPIST